MLYKKVVCKTMGNYLINDGRYKYDLIQKMYLSDPLSKNLKCINSCLSGNQKKKCGMNGCRLLHGDEFLVHSK